MLNPPFKFLLFAVLVCAVVTYVIVRPSSTHAATFVVNSLADDTISGNSLCTLREAIQTANDVGNGDCGGNSIAFDTITFSVSGTIRLASTLPTIITGVGPLRINGGSQITISGDSDNDGDGDVRIMRVNPDSTLFLENISMVKGRAAAGISAGSFGGAILNFGNLNLTNVTFTGNYSELGGAAIVNGGTLTVENSIFSGNESGTGGGGILNNNILFINNTTFSGNKAGGSGGAVYVFGDFTQTNNDFAQINNSTFSGNTSDNSGGALAVAHAALTVTNCTLTNNVSGGDGGAIHANINGNINITNSTIVANGLIYFNRDGGGVSANNMPITIRNSIVGGNSNGNCFGPIGAGSTNNLSTGAFDNSCGPSFTKVSNLAALNMGGLANNGGPTQTMSVNFPSPAIDTGSDSVCGAPVGAPLYGAGGKDQRGVTRPFGAHCDIGAYEANPSQSGSHLVVNVLGDTNDGSCDLLGQGTGNKDCTLREAIAATNGVAGADLITFNVSGTIIALSTLPAVTDTLTIDGAGAITLSGNNLVQVFSINGSGNLTLQAVAVTQGKGSGGGGAANSGTLSIVNSTFSNNQANTPFSAGGGGVFNSGTLNIINSTFTGNSGFQGGCVTNIGTVTVTNSTFSNNTASALGGGGCIRSFSSFSSSPVVTVVNSTFSGNGSGSSDTISKGSGGTLTLRNTIVANSVTPAQNCFGAITDGGGNLQFGGATANSCGGTIPTADPVLGALTGNGGPTQTMSLGANSAAINLGVATNCAANVGSPSFGGGGKDQRGNNRRTGFCDSGAFEAQPASNTAVPGGSGQSTLVSTAFPNPLEVTVKDVNNNLLGGAAVIYTAPGSGASATLNPTPALTNSSGVASTVATANAIAGGPYNVSANAGVGSLLFSLTNLASGPVVTARKTVSGTFAPGSTVVYTVTLSNIGSTTQADNPTNEFTDVLPSSLTLLSASSSSGTAVANVATRTVTWNGSIPGGASVEILIGATVNAGTEGTVISNQGTASYDSDNDLANETSVLTDDPNVAGGSDPTSFTVPGAPAVTIAKLSDGRAGQVAEPSSGTASMLFTVVLSSPAPASGSSVTFSTSDGPPALGNAVAGDDYTATLVTVNFATGEQLKVVSVPVLADSAAAESNEDFVVSLSNPVNAIIIDGTGKGTITNTNPAGTLLISELRAFGPGGSNDPNDDFVEIYNNTDSAHTVPAGGYGLFKMGADCNATPVLIGTIGAGTVIPPRGHFLFTGAAYSLASYGGTNAATSDVSLTVDLEPNRNLALFATTNVNQISSANRFDAMGFGVNTGAVCDLLREGTNEPALTTNLTSLGQHSYFRQICAFQTGCPTPGRPRDTNDNAADFIFADANGINASAGQRLGAPGPENLASPIKRDPVVNALPLDSLVSSTSAPNRVRDTNAVTNGSFGTLTLRWRIINNTGANVSRLRFRVIDITSFPSPGGGQADIRALSSATMTGVSVGDSGTCAAAQPPAVAPCTVTVQGLTLEEPPNQTNGGGMNATLSAGTITLANPLAAGASVNVQFRLGVQTTGTFRFWLVIEALP